MNMKRLSVLALAGLCALGFRIEDAGTITFGPDFASDYTAMDLGSVTGLPTNYGGMVFKAGDPNTLLIGGAANTASGLFYEVPVVRDASDNITGFGAITAFGTVGEYNVGTSLMVRMACSSRRSGM